MASAVPVPNPFDDMISSVPTSTNTKKTWQELRQAVRQTRKVQTPLGNRIPHNFHFRHIITETGQKTRIYFLGVPPGYRENTLLYTDLPAEPQSHVPQLIWNQLLESFGTSSQFSQLSKEEQLLRERKRMVTVGITSYDYDCVGKFAFAGASNLYSCDDRLDQGNFTVRVSMYRSYSVGVGIVNQYTIAPGGHITVL